VKKNNKLPLTRAEVKYQFKRKEKTDKIDK